MSFITAVRKSARHHRKDLLAVSFLAVITAVYFSPLFLPGESNRILIGDVVWLKLPLTVLAAARFTQPEVPLWNPHQFCGTPFLSDPTVAYFSPLSATLFLAASNQSANGVFMLLQVYTIIHMMLGAVFFFFLARELGLSPAAAAGGSLVFVFSGFFKAHLRHTDMIGSIIWLPAILAFLHRFARTGLPANAILAGLLLGFSFLSFHVNMAVITVMVTAAWTAYLAIRLLRAHRQKPAIYLLVAAAAALLIGLGLGTVQLYPLYVNSALSTRTGYTLEKIQSSGSYGLKEFINMVFPVYHPQGADMTRHGGSTNFWELHGYSGLLPLFLAAVGVMAAVRKKRGILFFLPLAIISLVIVCGPAGGIYTLLYHVVPGFNRFRIPARFIYLFCFSLAFFTCHGIERVVSGAGLARKLPAASAAVWFLILGSCVWLYTTKHPGWLVSLHLLVLAAGVLLFKSRRWRLITCSCLIILEMLFPFSCLVFAKAKPHNFFYTRELGAALTLPHRTLLHRVDDRDPFYRNSGLLYGYSSITGYHPLQLKHYADFMNTAQAVPDLLRLTGRDTVLERKPGATPGAFKVFKSSTNDGLPALLTRNLRVVSAHTMSNELKALAPVMNRMILLDEPPVYPVAETATGETQAATGETQTATGSTQTATGETISETINFEIIQPEHLVIDVTAMLPSVLFVSMVYHPGWKIFVNGRPGQLIKANGCFWGIPVPAGSSRIKAVFRPPDYAAGLAVSLATAYLLMLYGLWRLLRR